MSISKRNLPLTGWCSRLMRSDTIVLWCFKCFIYLWMWIDVSLQPGAGPARMWRRSSLCLEELDQKQKGWGIFNTHETSLIWGTMVTSQNIIPPLFPFHRFVFFFRYSRTLKHSSLKYINNLAASNWLLFCSRLIWRHIDWELLKACTTLRTEFTSRSHYDSRYCRSSSLPPLPVPSFSLMMS